jgi:hypothetical protein
VLIDTGKLAATSSELFHVPGIMSPLEHQQENLRANSSNMEVGNITANAMVELTRKRNGTQHSSALLMILLPYNKSHQNDPTALSTAWSLPKRTGY